MPKGAKEYGNENADELLSALDERDIKYLDLRQEIKKDGIDWGSMFF